ncbi:response regulator [Maridesulfovibrio sp.]|uniref:response regulator n=1 Tax=Maridesulfovibrio sp. TaxID=2795000 RepID=UPI0029F4CDF6|nr:response regulator [Maridesulfovibrio sp.]
MNMIKVLMVDDEERFRETTAKILSRKGFETLLAGSGEEALDKLSFSPDVIILDVRMGGMDGHEALQKIKEQKPDIPIIMLTGHGDLSGAKKAYSSGAFDYLAKPCDIDLLAAKINDAFHHAAPKKLPEKMVGSVMIPLDDYTEIDADSTVLEAIAALQKSIKGLVATNRLMESGHRSVIARNADGSTAGILSPRDLLHAVLPEYLSAPKPSTADSLQYSAMFWDGQFTTLAAKLADRSVRSLLSGEFLTIESSANLMEAANALITTGKRRIIVQENGKDVGIVREQELFYEIARIISSR